MQFMYDKDIPARFRYILDKAKQTIHDCSHIESYQQFQTSPGGMILFDATVMRIQVIGEMLKQIDDVSKGEILKHYPEIPWKSVFGMRNFISHEYCMVDPEKIFYTIKDDFPALIEVLETIVNDIESEKFE